MKFGQSQTRDEDARLVRGKGLYAGDRIPDDALWLHVLRSDHPAGEIKSIDVAAARSMPGIHAILTGGDADAGEMEGFTVRFIPPGTKVDANPVRPLATDQVRYVGEPIAAIVADSATQAMDAAEAIVVDIEARPAVIDARAADEIGAPELWPQGNRIFTQEQGDRAGYEAALHDATHVVKSRIDISRVTAVTMEPRNALAKPADDGFLLITGTQAPHRVRAEAAHVLGMAETSLRVQVAEVGGSFGTRNGAYPEDILTLWAARKFNRPVGWAASRSEAFLTDTQSRPQSVDVTLALDADFGFLALGVDAFAPVGAYVGPMSLHPMTGSLPGLAGCYRTPVIHSIMRGMHVNTIHMAPYRGAGRPEAIFLIERIVDIAAHRLGIDRFELRRRNLIAAEDMPYATPLGYVYDSGDFPKAFEKALQAADWPGFAARRVEAKTRGRLRGLGLACAIESAGAAFGPQQLPEFGALSVSPTGTLNVRAGSGDCGQGHATALAQIAERLLGWEGEIVVQTGDTGLVEQGMGTFGSRTMGAAGAALASTADKIIATALLDAAKHFEVDSNDVIFQSGHFGIAGTDLSISLQALAQATDKTYAEQSFVSADAGTFPNGVHLAEIEIDPETGALELIRYTVVDDVGEVVNPLLLAGQLHGGIAQGLGQAFMEQIVYDAHGAMLTGSLMDYALPRATDLAPIIMEHSPTATKANPLGVKGAGESGVVGALSCGISAVHDALAPLGIEDMAMPASPHRIWQAIQSSNAKVDDL